MGSPGGCTTQAPGHVQDQILSTKVDYVGGSSIRIRSILCPQYQDKFYAPFINGVYLGKNTFVASLQTFDLVIPVDAGTTVASVYIEDGGDWSVFDNDFVPLGSAEADDALTAQRLQFSWDSPYSLTTVRGDAQLSGITITGAQRGVNVERSNLPTRGRLSYSITTSDVANTHVIRLWSGSELVAEGVRIGNGAVTIAEINSSGLSSTATLAYTADVIPGVAYIELRWPKSYAINYSTSALAYPRTAETTINDNGDDSYTYLSPIIAAGTYNWNILTVDDDGVTQTAGFASTTAQTIYSPPAAPTITNITAAAGNFTVTFTNGEASCTYTIYSSPVDYPINFGAYATPGPVVTALNATTATVPIPAGGPGLIRFVARATKAGVQEQTDLEYLVEIDGSNAIVPPRPNRANIAGITISSGLTLAVSALVFTEDQDVAATTAELYVVAYAGTITIGTAQASAALSTAVAGLQRATVSYTVGGAGWYRVCVVAKSAAGSTSREFTEYIVYLSATAPGVVPTLNAKVIRGR